jgi:hypothetical protein
MSVVNTENICIVTSSFQFPGKNEYVTVTHIVNPCKFMVQLKEDQTTLKKLSRQINSWANTSRAKDIPTEVKPGMYTYTDKVKRGNKNMSQLINSWANTSRMKNILIDIKPGTCM